MSVLGLWISGLNPCTGWVYGIASQSVWIAYGLVTHQPGMIAFSAAFIGLYGGTSGAGAAHASSGKASDDPGES